MPQVDFYILEGNRQPDHVACQLTARAFQQDLKILIRTRDEATAQALDNRLWTFSDISFIPHSLLSEDQGDISSPVLVSWQTCPPTHRDVMLNLGARIPDCVSDFARIVEIVTPDDESRQAARQRYRDYRERDFDLETHTIE